MPSKQNAFPCSLRWSATASLLALLLLVGIWGCGGGGGGSGGGTIPGGIIMGSLQGLSNAAAWTGEAWLEEYPSIRSTVASTGAFLLSGVPTDQACHVVARITYPGGTMLGVRASGVEKSINAASAGSSTLWARSGPLQAGYTEISHVLTLEPGVKALTGYLLDETGKPVTDGRVTFWGITLPTAIDGSFLVPELPSSTLELSLSFEAPGRQANLLSVPMPDVAYPPVFRFTMLPAASENHPPLLAVASAPSAVVPGQRVTIGISIDDPDAADTALTPSWEASAGTLEAGADRLRRIWTAPAEGGMATVTIRVTDHAGVSGEAQIGWAVGGITGILPRIATFTPQNGVPGSWVTITGTGFASSAGGNPEVRFNGLSASLKEWNATRIVAMVPEEAETGPLSVVTSDGVSTAATFTVMDFQIGMTPLYGPPETIITLQGFGFDADDPGKVLVNGREATILLWSDKTIQARVPRLATTGLVKAVIRGREHTVDTFTISKATALSPARALRGSSITMTGAGFGPDQGTSELRLASGVVVVPDSWSDGEITFTIPLQAVTGPVSIKIWGLTIQTPNLSVEYANRYQVAESWSGLRYSAFPMTPGVAVAADGTVFLADRDNCVIWKFSPDGSTVTRLGSKGQEPAQLLDPWGLVIDRDGNLWVSDRGNHRLQKTDRDGNLLLTVGTAGDDPGKFNAPSGMAVDAAGNIWVADADNNRLQQFSADGTFIQTIGSVGTGDGEFNYPNGIAISAAGDIYVADTDNNRVQRLDSNGNAIGWWGLDNLGSTGWHAAGTGRTGVRGSALWQFANPTALAFEAGGKLIVADTANNRLQVLPAGAGGATQIATGGEQAGQLDGPTGIAVLGASVWVADYGNSRAQRFGITGAYEAERKPDLAALLTMCDRIALDEERGLVYVSDSAEGLINVFTTSGTFVRRVGSKGTGEGQMREPSGLQIAEDGSLWVVDSGNGRLHQFDADGRLLGTIGSFGTGDGQFRSPAGLELLQNGDLMIADAGNHRIQIVGPDGTWKKSFGTFGHGNGEFDTPRGVAEDINGYIYVADTANARVQKLASSGAFVGWWGADTAGGDGWHGTDTSISAQPDQGPCRFLGPSDVTVDSEGSIFVIDG
ncbi:IPT/TIG domain-containing protein, partial [Candidatus Ozemobacteraceae bacterium]|nr:IPT/TIG domain-containing protein [Candidatus Ozemobacteraceae bacterium]